MQGGAGGGNSVCEKVQNRATPHILLGGGVKKSEYK